MHIKNVKLGLKLCEYESQPTISCGIYHPSDARNAKGKEFLLHQLGVRIKRWIRWFQCWYGIQEIRKFNFPFLDNANGQYHYVKFDWYFFKDRWEVEGKSLKKITASDTFSFSVAYLLMVIRG